MTLNELIDAALKAKQTLGGEAKVTVSSEDAEDDTYAIVLDSYEFINEFQIII